MAKTGQAVILDGIKGKFVLREYPVPKAAPGTVLLKQELGGICGTDVHIFHGHMPGLSYPALLGHEIVGTIEELGDGVTTDFFGKPVGAGDRVIVVPGISCGTCYFCTVVKTPTRCPNVRAYGFCPDPDSPPHFTGGYGQYVYLSIPNTVFLKTSLPPEIAVLLEPLSVAVHGTDRSNIRIGDCAVIQGAGAIGLMALICARSAGATRTILIGAPRERLELGKRLGADIVIDINEVKDPEERRKVVRDNSYGGFGADVVYECAGVPKAVAEGAQLLRDSGTLVELGHFTDVGTVPINPYRDILVKHAKIVGTYGDELEQMVRGLRVLERRDYPFEELLTHRVPLNAVGEAVQALTTTYRLGGRDIIKAAVSGWPA